MTPDRDAHAIDTLPRLEALLGPLSDASVHKELPYVHPAYRAMIAASPFAVLATTGPGGLDASPRGGAPGFVKALDAHTLLIPDAPGNNRLDTLENIIQTGQVGLLFLVPGVDETLRVNGTAVLSTDDADLAACADARRVPKLVIRVTVQAAYLHCAKALMRSALWDPARHVDRAVLPSMGQMLKDQIGGDQPLESQAQMLARYAAEL
mgnify:CR=1 FL=1